MPSIMHLMTIHAPAKTVYRAITTADGISKWWTRDVTIEPKVGAVGEMSFYGKRFIAQLKVADLQSNALVRWQITNHAWDGKEVEFVVRPNGNDTTIAFAHRGFPKEDEGYAGATTRWGYYLISLKRYLETAKGSPNPDDLDAFG